MLEVLSIGTYPWNPNGDKVSVLVSRVANVVIQMVLAAGFSPAT